MVLVAGIAASVLIQTSGTLETRAMATGRETTSEVATGIEIEDICAWANTNDDISYLALSVRPRCGSTEIDLNDTILEISDTNKKIVLNFTGQLLVDEDDIDGDFFNSANFDNLQAISFSAIIIEDTDDSISSSQPILTRGDHVYLTIDLADASGFNKIAERSDMWGNIIPLEGAMSVFKFRTPNTFFRNIIELGDNT